MDDSQQRNPIEVLADEFVNRYRNGQRPSLMEYVDRHPELADEIRELFPLLQEMEVARSVVPMTETASSVPLATPDIKQLGDYRIIREIGRGGMGIVYEAEQVSLGRRVALKVLPANVLNKTKHRSRFERESKAAASLHHTNIVPVFGVGEASGLDYYVMQLIDGHGIDRVLVELKQISAGAVSGVESTQDDVSTVFSIASKLCGSSSSHSHSEPSLDTERLSKSPTGVAGESREPQRRKKRGMYWDNVALIGVQVARALEHAHQQGVLHRDIKPANLLLDITGTVWVTDFGLARQDTDQRLTETGDVLGTLRYMAPESLKGVADERSEVFSLGLTLYELLVLTPAYDQQNRNKLIDSVLNVRIEPIGKLRSEVPSDLQTIVHKALESDPDHRYESPGKLADDLTRFLNDEPIQARRVSLPERFWRWRRQNPGLAALATSLLLIVSLTAIGSTIAAGYFLSLSNRLDNTVGELQVARNTAENRADENLQLAEQADHARRLSDATLADMYAQRGVLTGNEGKFAAAALWFANAALLTPNDADRRAANRLRAKNWLSRAMRPLAVFDLEGRLLKTLEHQPGGSLVMMRMAESLRVWDWRRDAVVPWTKYQDSVACACWSPAGKLIAIASSDGTVRIRDFETGKLVFDFEPEGDVETIAWSPNGTFIATASEMVQVWNVSEQPTMTIQWRHPKRVYGLTFNRAGDRLLTGCLDRKARLFQVSSSPTTGSTSEARLLHEFRHAPAEENNRSKPLFFNADRKVVTVDGNRCLWWDVTSGKDVTPPLQSEPAGFILSLATSKDGNWIAAGGKLSAMLWNVEGESFPLEHGNNVRDLHFDPKSESLLTISLNQNASIWTLPPREMKPILFPQHETFSIASISTSGQHIAVGGGQQVMLWEMPGNNLTVGPIRQWSGQVWRPRISTDGLLATPAGMTKHGEIRVTNRKSLGVIRMTDGTKAGPMIDLNGQLIDSCFCNSRRSVAAACQQSEEGFFVVHDISTGRRLFEPVITPALPSRLASRPGADELAVLCGDGTLVVASTADGTVARQIKLESWRGEANGFCQIAYTPDGQTLLALTPNHHIEVLEAQSGKRKFPPILPVVKDGPCRAMDISADSRWLVTGVNGTNLVRVWDLSTGQPAGPAIPHTGQHYGITSVAFSPDGNHVLTGHEKGIARFWDWRTGKLLVPPMSHPQGTVDVKITADGRYAVTGIRLGTIYFWDLASGKQMAPPADYGLPIGSTHALGMGADRLIVSDKARYPLLDLSAVFEPPNESTDELVNAASVCSNQWHQSGELSPMTPSQWASRWSTYKKTLTKDLLLDSDDQQSGESKATEWSEVRLAELTSAIDRAQHSPAPLVARAIFLERLGKWDLAAVDLLRAVELEPGNPNVWAYAAYALILSGNEQGYREHCQRMLKRFQTTKRLQQADMLSKTCLMRTETVDISALPIDVVRKAASTPGISYRYFFVACCALHSYRSGDAQSAIEWTEKVTGASPDATKLALIVQAMAQHQLGQVDEARTTLRRAEAMLPSELRTLGTGAYDGQLPLEKNLRQDDLVAEILRREAAAMIWE